MAPDLSSLSVEDLLALKQGQPSAAPAGASPAVPANLSSLSTEELLALKNSSVNKDWTIAGSIGNFGSGVVEGVTGLIGLAVDLNPMQQGGPKIDFPMSKAIAEALAPYLAEKDPQYRYARTMGQFAAPVPVKGANSLRTLLTSLVSGIGAQYAEDATGDSKIAPIVGAVAAGSAASATDDLARFLKRVFVGASEEEIAGTAAKVLAEKTGLTADDLARVNAMPEDSLSSLRTTAEKTQNPGMAQLEKTLAFEGPNANTYGALEAQRVNAREALLNQATDVPAVNAEKLNADLIGTAADVQQKMHNNASAFWDNLPRDKAVLLTDDQDVLRALMKEGDAGIPVKAEVKNLVEQVTGTKKNFIAGKTVGQLQKIRSDALRLGRNRELTALDERLLSQLSESIDSAMEKGLSGKDYQNWKAARQATAAEKEAFKRGTVGGYLTSDDVRVSNALKKAFKGDRQSIVELRTAIGEDPALLERVKRGVLDEMPRNVQGNLTPAGMKKFLSANETGLRELFLDSHYSNFKKISEDLASQAGVKDLADLASRGGSATAQRQTVAGAVQDAIVDSLVPGTSGWLSKTINAIKKGASLSDAQAVEDLIFKASLDSRFAEKLARTPTRRRIVDALEMIKESRDNILKSGGIATAKELARTEDNRSPMAKLLDQVSENPKQPGIADQLSSIIGKPVKKSPVSEEFDGQVKKIASDLGADPEHLLQVMAFETGGTFDPAQKNKAGSGAVGLIQFMPETAKALTGADSKEAATKILSSMSATEQLDYVKKYLAPFKGKLKTLEDVYMAVLYPKAVGKDPDYALFRQGSKAYWQNRGLDINDDGIITKLEAANKAKSFEV